MAFRLISRNLSNIPNNLNRKTLKKSPLFYGGLGFGTVFGSLYFYNKNDGVDFWHLGVARFGRAALTVAKIGFDYKKNLIGSNLDKESQEYADLMSEIHLRSAKQLLKLCENNGGCFMQALSYWLIASDTVTQIQAVTSRGRPQCCHVRGSDVADKQQFAVLILY